MLCAAHLGDRNFDGKGAVGIGGGNSLQQDPECAFVCVHCMCVSSSGQSNLDGAASLCTDGHDDVSEWDLGNAIDRGP